MSTPRSRPPQFRLHDWVSLLYGPRTVLAQVVEDRGPIGVHGRRLYRVRIELAQGESTTLEVPEEYLGAVSEADRAAWRMAGTMAIHQTVTYFNHEKDGHGISRPWHHYLVVAKSGSKPGSGLASIIVLSQARATEIAQGPFETVVVSSGGLEAALAKAQEVLDAQHPELKKLVGEKRP